MSTSSLGADLAQARRPWAKGAAPGGGRPWATKGTAPGGELCAGVQQGNATAGPMYAVPDVIAMEGMAAPQTQAQAGEPPVDIPEATRRMIVAINAMNWLLEEAKDGQDEQCGAQGKAELWTYTPVNGKTIHPREVPEIHGKMIGNPLSPGDSFWVVEEKKVGSVTFLRLPGGEGWLFDHKPDVGLMCTRAQTQEAQKSITNTPELKPKPAQPKPAPPALEPKQGPGVNRRILVLSACLVGVFLLTVGVICVDAGSWEQAIIPIAWLVALLVISGGALFLVHKCQPTKEVPMLQEPLNGNYRRP